MSSLLSSQAVVLATAMAVSGSVILFALRWQRPFPDTHFAARRNSASSPGNLRSCIVSGERKLWRTKKKKRVHFADHLVEAVEVIGATQEEYTTDEESTDEEEGEREMFNARLDDDDSPPPDGRRAGGMPANRVALYNGILRDRLQRMACSY